MSETLSPREHAVMLARTLLWCAEERVHADDIHNNSVEATEGMMEATVVTRAEEYLGTQAEIAPLAAFVERLMPMELHMRQGANDARRKASLRTPRVLEVAATHIAGSRSEQGADLLRLILQRTLAGLQQQQQENDDGGDAVEAEVDLALELQRSFCLMLAYNGFVTRDMVQVFLDVHPEALRTRWTRDDAPGHAPLPLHMAVTNKTMDLGVIAFLVEQHPAAVWTADGRGFFPLHHIPKDVPIDERRSTLVTHLLRAYPDERDGEEKPRVRRHGEPAKSAEAPAVASQPTVLQAVTTIPLSLLGTATQTAHQNYHPLSVQGRLKVGVHVALRGAAAAFKFQTGGHAAPKLREPVEVALSCGHMQLAGAAATRVQSWYTAQMLQAILTGARHGHIAVAEATFYAWKPASTYQVGCATPVNAQNMMEWAAVLALGWRDPNWAWLDEVLSPAFAIWDPKHHNKVGSFAAILSGDVERAKTKIRPESIVLNPTLQTICLRLLAARSGSLAMLEYVTETLQSQDTCCCNGPCAAALEACEQDRVDLLELMFHGGRCRGSSPREGSFAPAARTGTTCMDTAARFGSMHVLRWLHVHTAEECTSAGIVHAAMAGSVETLKFLRDKRNAAAPQLALHRAVLYSSPRTLDVVEYLCGHGLCMVDTGAIRNALAATNVRIDVIVYLLQHASRAALADLARLLTSGQLSPAECDHVWVAANQCDRDEGDLAVQLGFDAPARLLTPSAQADEANSSRGASYYFSSGPNASSRGANGGGSGGASISSDAQLAAALAASDPDDSQRAVGGKRGRNTRHAVSHGTTDSSTPTSRPAPAPAPAPAAVFHFARESVGTTTTTAAATKSHFSFGAPRAPDIAELSPPHRMGGGTGASRPSIFSRAQAPHSSSGVRTQQNAGGGALTFTFGSGDTGTGTGSRRNRHATTARRRQNKQQQR